MYNYLVITALIVLDLKQDALNTIYIVSFKSF
jgi:hypothetical protein